jgi:hypothetical protein
MTRLATLHAQGFDRSSHTFGRPNLISVACSQCQSAVINGVACHERGCPNQVYECRGCNATVNRKGSYCEDCL